jgi:hypothetical protein
MNGLETESFSTALALEDERERSLPERLKFARPFSYYSRGLYAELLQPYLSRFARDRILVLKFEDVIAAPRGLASRLHTFLGIALRPGDVEGVGVINPAEPYDPLDEGTRRALAERYAEPNRQLAQLLGSDFRVWE